jgi:hypothetical protein
VDARKTWKTWENMGTDVPRFYVPHISGKPMKSRLGGWPTFNDLCEHHSQLRRVAHPLKPTKTLGGPSFAGLSQRVGLSRLSPRRILDATYCRANLHRRQPTRINSISDKTPSCPHPEKAHPCKKNARMGHPGFLLASKGEPSADRRCFTFRSRA